jgi:glycine betaine/proline transport system ATP-binding protein
VAYGLEIQGIKKEARNRRAQKSIEDVGLKGYENSYPDELSGGMQQRVGLARALANDSDILLMDEAFSALDPLIRKVRTNVICKINWVQCLFYEIWTSTQVGDRIAIMKNGQIVQVRTADEILENPANDYVEFCQRR